MDLKKAGKMAIPPAAAVLASEIATRTEYYKAASVKAADAKIKARVALAATAGVTAETLANFDKSSLDSMEMKAIRFGAGILAGILAAMIVSEVI